GAYELLAPVGTTITRLEVRSVLDEILFTKDGEWDETTGDMTLPVTLSSFTATLTSTGNAVLLKWTTQSETDLMGYYIYRSNEDNQSTANRQSELISANNTNSESNYVWSDTELEDGVYYYWLKVVERNGETEIHGSVKATINNDSPQTPDYEAQTVFNSIYPNPFNPTTTIFYALGEVSNVKVSIYNVKGELVKNYDMANQSIGDHKIVWNGFDNNNKACTSGIYFFRVETDSYSMTKKAVMIK
ncbi:MAG TPA: FlgD immunoglobulin-like domain containing protein, partial [Candidatus Cloacimonadota bacterium]|nr:FlgD immunoglobulin-like domain containing protein [Candidatus Cloacimonadota bacterium]